MNQTDNILNHLSNLLYSQTNTGSPFFALTLGVIVALMKLSIKACLSSFTPTTETKMGLVLHFSSVHNDTIKRK